MQTQLVGAPLSATKQSVTLPKLKNLHSISDFQDELVPNTSHHPHDARLRRCNALSTLLCALFIKPSFINKIALKSATQLEMHKDTHDWFTILVNILKEVLPQVGNYGALIDPSAEFDKLNVIENATYSQMASRRVIDKRVLSHCKDDLPPNKIDKNY